MTIKQNGGIFGRNPEFNDVSAKDVSVTDEITILENGVDVGGVRSLSGQAQLSGTTTGITFGVQSVLPTNGGSAIQNGTRDIGGASNFWRNMYVSTGVYFGSQTTATHLDGYEEGVFTPTLTTDATDFSSVTYDPAVFGSYTKVGNVVHIQLFMQTDAVTKGSASGNVIIGGLPFTADGTSPLAVATSKDWLADYPTRAYVADGATTISLLTNANNTADDENVVVADVKTLGNDNTLRLSGTYRAS